MFPLEIRKSFPRLLYVFLCIKFIFYIFVFIAGANNLKDKESVEDISNDIMDMAISIRNEKTNVFVSGLTVRNDRLKEKGKSVNSLLKRRCDEEKICFVDNTNINVGMLNNSGLHLN